MKRILIIAGEPSADLHGANLVKAIRYKINSRTRMVQSQALNVSSSSTSAAMDQNFGIKADNTDEQMNTVEFIGIGGRRMSQEGVKLIFDADKIAVVGISEVLKHIGMIRQAFRSVEANVAKDHFDLGILIDFPDFNLRLAKKLYDIGIPLVYYISPQVWAWRKGRIKQIAKYFKKVLVIFSFEEPIYKQAGVDVKFVGHPLVKIVKMTRTKQELLKLYDIPLNRRIIAMLPGSRDSEVKRHFPIMLKAASILKEQHNNLMFVIPVLSSQSDLCRTIASNFNLPIRIIVNDTYNAVGMSEFAVVTSGTATLETALLGIPMIIIYRVSFFSHIVARMLLSIKRIGIVNIATGEDIVPELVQNKLTPQNLADMINVYLKGELSYNRFKEGYAKLRRVLTDKDASENAADDILSMLGLSA
ncbi:MAG: lipid-A-disaccharide synthase [bacterium]